MKMMHRRKFITGTMITLPTVAVHLSSGVASAQRGEYKNDLEILNFALVAEYFLSQFYREANVGLSSLEERLVADIGADEDVHIASITRTLQNLGEAPVRAPAINFGNALSSRERMLRFALKFENLFAGAYLGAAGSIQSRDVLVAAAGILGVEERHAAVIATLLGAPAEGGVFEGSLQKPATKDQVLASLKPYIKGAASAADDAAVTL
jgi:hypothetical protein